MPRLLTPVIALLLGGLVLAGSPAQGQDDDGTADVADAGRDPALRGSRGLQRLARDLSARERALERRERTVDDREADVLAAEADLARRLESLEEVRTQLEDLLDQIDQIEEERLATLVGATSKMRDKQAAAVLTEMDEDLAVQVLDRLNATKAGRAMAAMDPVKAATLAEKMTRPITLPGGSR